MTILAKSTKSSEATIYVEVVSCSVLLTIKKDEFKGHFLAFL